MTQSDRNANSLATARRRLIGAPAKAGARDRVRESHPLLDAVFRGARGATILKAYKNAPGSASLLNIMATFPA
jgi:hypothetical protein